VNRLYFDLQNGISGDMAVSALLSFDNDFDYLKKRLKEIDVKEYKLKYWKEKRNGILGSRFSVIVSNKTLPGRSFSDIKKLIDKSKLEKNEKILSKKIFSNIASAEASVHGVDVEKVHFHEVGAVDSIVDIISFSILYTKHNIKEAFSSYVHLGNGTTMCMHGLMPIPAPATLEILKDLPVVGTNKNYELTTPTGASIIKSVVKEFGNIPHGIIKNSGIGFGSKANDLNALRIIQLSDIDEISKEQSNIVIVAEVTIDDSTPEEVSFLQEQLFLDDALDVFITPIYMKKNRPAFNITIICNPKDFNKCSDTVLLKSSSFGLRYQYNYRKVVDREIKNIKTPFGGIKVKIGYYNGKIIKVSPEYEDCKKASEKENLPFRKIYDEVVKVSHEVLDY